MYIELCAGLELGQPLTVSACDVCMSECVYISVCMYWTMSACLCVYIYVYAHKCECMCIYFYFAQELRVYIFMIIH